MGVRTPPLGPYFQHVNEETSFMPAVYFNVETPPIAHFWLHRWLLEYHSTSPLTFFNLTTKMTFISCVILSNSPNYFIFPFCFISCHLMQYRPNCNSGPELHTMCAYSSVLQVEIWGIVESIPKMLGLISGDRFVLPPPTF